MMDGIIENDGWEYVKYHWNW